jgi:hypothetical protein
VMLLLCMVSVDDVAQFRQLLDALAAGGSI